MLMKNNNAHMKWTKECEFCIFTNYEIMGINTGSGKCAHFWRECHTERMQDSTKADKK